MKLRLAQPTMLIDIGRIRNCRTSKMPVITLSLAHSPGIWTLRIQYSQTVCAAVRSRGFTCGRCPGTPSRHHWRLTCSCRLGRPAGNDMALGATYVAQGHKVTPIAAKDFYQALRVLKPDEMLTEIRVPMAGRLGFSKFNRRAQDWAIVGVAAWRNNGSSGVALVNMGSTPLGHEREYFANRCGINQRCGRARSRRSYSARRPECIE